MTTMLQTLSKEQEQFLIRGLVDIASWVNCDCLPRAQELNNDELASSLLFVIELVRKALEESGCGELKIDGLTH